APAIPLETIVATGLRPRTPAKESVLFPDSKYAVMRTGWNPESYFMLINYGPFANHAHYDILDFEIFANGIPLAVDAGIGVKGYSDPNHTTWYKTSAAHNMVTVDEADCVKRDIEGEGLIWSAQRSTDYFRAWHKGYQRYHDALCRRDIAFVREGYWVIIDQIQTPHAGKKLDWHLHTPLHLQRRGAAFVSEEIPGAVFRIPDADTTTCRFMQRTAPADLRGIPGEPENRDIDWLTLRKRAVADSTRDRFAVLIYPLAESAKVGWKEIGFEELPAPDPAVRICRVKTPAFSDLLIFSDGQMRRFAPDIEGDFHFAWFRSVGETAHQVSAVGMSRLVWGDRIDTRLAERSDFEHR
ncbi:heparinase II/III-family protein, partial [candidate division KSB1 bacterium]|nr:heparinase II/III-family protein [candidate division KSB1 bacterium]